jgi:hypothetical protein
MADTELQSCAYHIVRYAPNLVRDEWINIGVVLFDPISGRVVRRLVEEPGEFARVRRLHPTADEDFLRNLGGVFDAPRNGDRANGLAWLGKLEDTLSNTIQLSPRRGVLTTDFEAELDRLYREQVEPPRAGRPDVREIRTRSDIRARAADFLRLEGLLGRMQRGVRVADYTYPGDPLRMDFAYRRNGTRGFVQALPLGRDPGQAKVLAFTADAIRARVEHTEFTAITEVDPAREDGRHRFVATLLEEKQISVVPLARLRGWAHDLGPRLRANGGA